MRKVRGASGQNKYRVEVTKQLEKPTIRRQGGFNRGAKSLELYTKLTRNRPQVRAVQGHRREASGEPAEASNVGPTENVTESCEMTVTSVGGQS